MLRFLRHLPATNRWINAVLLLPLLLVGSPERLVASDHLAPGLQSIHADSTGFDSLAEMGAEGDADDADGHAAVLRAPLGGCPVVAGAACPAAAAPALPRRVRTAASGRAPPLS